MSEGPEEDDDGLELQPTEEEILASLVLPPGFHDRQWPQ